MNVYDTSFVLSSHAQEPGNEDSVMHKTFFLGSMLLQEKVLCQQQAVRLLGEGETPPSLYF